MEIDGKGHGIEGSLASRGRDRGGCLGMEWEKEGGEDISCKWK